VLKRKSIRLGFAGDLMLGGEAVRYGQAHGLDPVYAFKSLEPTIAELDVLCVNLEGPLFEGTEPMDKPILLSNHPATVEVLKLPGICVCNLANNHSFDYGAEALFKTQQHLEKHGIRHVGAGSSSTDARAAVVIERCGWRIGCLAFTATGECLEPVIARDGKPGCASLENQAPPFRAVRRLRKSVDLVIVMLHWGLEFHEYPSAAQVRLARALVDAGANIIAGHHPHALQAVETYNGAVIAYSLGHFYMPPFRLSMNGALKNGPATKNGPVFYPRAASREFALLRVELPSGFPRSAGAVNIVAGGLDEEFRLRPYNRAGLKSFRSRLENLGCPLRNGGYAGFWKQYRNWRRRELAAWRQWPAAEELEVQTHLEGKS
jgi:hypothetical protein